MNSESKTSKVSKKFLIASILFSFLFIGWISTQRTSSLTIINDNTVLLSPFEYHIVSINATKGEALSGDWEASPSDIITQPFLVFILDSDHLATWLESENLTQAIGRFPANELLYLYDPLFRIDDIPLDNYRTDVINIKVPHTDTWHLVFYAGASIIPLTFTWHLDVFPGYLLDAVLYSLGGVIFVAIVTVGAIKIVKDKRRTYEEEFDEIIKDSQIDTNEDIGLGSLEEENEEYIEDN